MPICQIKLVTPTYDVQLTPMLVGVWFVSGLVMAHY